MQPTLVFSHANSFPAGTYRLLFEAWRDAGLRVFALPQYGHDPAFPVSSNWPRLRDQLLHFVQQQAPGQPVHLVGHSLGGFLSLLAACRQPAMARSVVLLDAPVVAGWRAHSLHAVKLSGLIGRAPPPRIAARRRWQWPSAEAALAHFAGKAAFARWHPDVLRDYIASGMVPDPDHGHGHGHGPPHGAAAVVAPDPGDGPARGLAPHPDRSAPATQRPAPTGAVRLAFTREIESAIYATLPHHLGRVLRRHPPHCPVAYVGGTRSVEGRQAGLAATRALVQDRLAWVDGTHLFPMEKPAETAAAVLRFVL